MSGGNGIEKLIDYEDFVGKDLVMEALRAKREEVLASGWRDRALIARGIGEAIEVLTELFGKAGIS